MEHYESYFMPHIWQRGEDITHTNAVSIMTHTKELIEAVVTGTYSYDVYITLSDDDIYMSCTCPFADSGENCKHMAAVLIKTSTESVGLVLMDSKSHTEQQFDHFKEKIKTCDLDEIADFFAGQLMENDQMKRSFVAKFSSEEVDIKYMIKAFNKIVKFYLGRDGFINYSRAKDFFKELSLYFEDLEVMLNDGMVVECAEIFTSVMLGFDGLPLDDSAGYTTILYDQLLEFVEKILNSENDEASELIYLWLEKINEDANSWYLKEIFYDLWSSQYSNEDLLDRTILMLEKELAIFLSAGESTDNYGLIRCLMNLVRNKEEREDSKTSILTLIKPYEKEAMVTRYLIELAQKQNNEEEEERLLLFGIKEADKKRHHGTVSDFSKSLCQFYKRVGQTETYKSMLRKLVLESHWSLDFYLEYKSIFDDQTWIHMRSGLIIELAKKRNNRLLPDIYVEENMHENLLSWLKDNPQLEHIRSYSLDLPENYSDEVLTLFLTGLDRLASRSGSKSHYKHIIEWMAYIDVLPNGSEAIEQKVTEYRVQFKRRPNFIKILNASF